MGDKLAKEINLMLATGAAKYLHVSRDVIRDRLKPYAVHEKTELYSLDDVEDLRRTLFKEDPKNLNAYFQHYNNLCSNYGPITMSRQIRILEL